MKMLNNDFNEGYQEMEELVEYMRMEISMPILETGLKAE